MRSGSLTTEHGNTRIRANEAILTSSLLDMDHLERKRSEVQPRLLGLGQAANCVGGCKVFDKGF